MKRIREYNQQYEAITRSVIIVVTAIIGAIGLNMFLIPANVFSAGINGVSQLISGVLEMSMGIKIDTGIFIFVLNIPIFVLGWVKLGPKSTIYSFFTVLAFSIATLIIPIQPLLNDTLSNSIIGGVLIGLGSALCFKYGFTTGGFDLLSIIISKLTGRSVGSLMFLMNFVIIFFAGLLYSWEQAIYTIISIYCLSLVVDKIHTSGHKLTLMIITQSTEEAMIESLRKTIVRGITILPGIGGFSKEKRSVFMVVISRYELYDVEKAIYQVDPKAFVNVMPTEHVMGLFYTEEQQREMRKNAYGQME